MDQPSNPKIDRIKACTDTAWPFDAIRGIELAAKIKKDQFNLKPLADKATTAPEIRAAVLAA